MMSRASHYLSLLPLLACAGCVVPAGPDWIDPEGNVPPSLVLAIPPVGSVLGGGGESGGPLAVEVTLADQNARDELHVRWIVDYPPYVDGVSRTALRQTLLSGSIERKAIAFAPICSDVVHGTGEHRLLLAVSDRDFVAEEDSGGQLDMPSNGFLLEASWTFTLQCQ